MKLSRPARLSCERHQMDGEPNFPRLLDSAQGGGAPRYGKHDAIAQVAPSLLATRPKMGPILVPKHPSHGIVSQNSAAKRNTNHISSSPEPGPATSNLVPGCQATTTLKLVLNKLSLRRRQQVPCELVAVMQHLGISGLGRLVNSHGGGVL